MSEERSIQRKMQRKWQKIQREIQQELEVQEAIESNQIPPENSEIQMDEIEIIELDSLPHNNAPGDFGDEDMAAEDLEDENVVAESFEDEDETAEDYEDEDLEDENRSRETGEYFNINFKRLGDSDLEIRDCLRLWSLHNGVPRDSVDGLLNILVKKGHLNLPLTNKTLVGTSQVKIILEPMEQSGEGFGEFYYFGIQNRINTLRYNFLRDPSYNKISFDVGIDGISSIFKASPLELWPILMAFNGMKRIPPILVAAYWGKGKPKSSDEFLKKFVEEINELRQRGGIMVDSESNMVKDFEIHHFGCDAPAKSFIKGVQGHTGHHSCNFCDKMSETITIYNESGEIATINVMSNTAGVPRSNRSFRNRDDSQHHNKLHKTELEKILPEIDMVWKFPNDAMHLCDLGVGKAVISHIINGKAKNITGKFSEEDMKILTKRNFSFVKYTPVEFNRKPGSFKYVTHWKATDFRFFMLYSGMILLSHRNIHPDLYIHFLSMSFAYRFVSTPGIENDNVNLQAAKELFNFFVSQYRHNYGIKSVSYNIHNILHIVEGVERYGAVDNFANYKFENYLQEIKGHIRKKSQVLQQIFKRVEELDLMNDLMEKNQDEGPFQPFPGSTKSYNGFKFGEFTLKINEADSCCKVVKGAEEFLFLIKIILEEDGVVIFKGYRYLNLESFCKEPLDSGEFLGIFKGKNLSHQLEMISVEDVKLKYVRLPLENNEFVFSPMLHHL